MFNPHSMAYPANATFEHQSTSSRLWALLTLIPIKHIILIPHMFVLFFVGIAAGFCAIIGVFAVLFTGKYPQSFENLIMGLYRWQWRLMTYVFCMQDKYPAFGLKEVDDPSNVTFEHQATSSRLWALLTLIPIKGILLIPHMAVLFVMSIIACVAAFLGLFAVLFTGKYPQSFENAIVTMFKYQTRVNVYYLCMTDKYPPISWKE